MKLESITIRNFRSFGEQARKIVFEPGITAFVGGNGSGKTAVFQALSRLFGVTTGQRLVRRQDFHVKPDQDELPSGASLFIEFPNWKGLTRIRSTMPFRSSFSRWRPPRPAIRSRSGFASRPPGRMTGRPTEPLMKTLDG